MAFTVGQGQIFGFLGPSGAGKTTTQQIIIGLREGWRGSVRLFGRELRRWSGDLYDQIGVSFELPAGYVRLTVREDLAHFAMLHGTAPLDIDELLGAVGLTAARDQLVGALSKGMRVRLNLARALLHRPRLLFLDEPTSGLDPVTARSIRAVIAEERDRGATVFLTTHDMVTADTLCDRVAFVVDGRIAACDRPRTLKLGDRARQIRVEYRDGADLRSQLFDVGASDRPPAGRDDRTGAVCVAGHERGRSAARRPAWCRSCVAAAVDRRRGVVRGPQRATAGARERWHGSRAVTTPACATHSGVVGASWELGRRDRSAVLRACRPADAAARRGAAGARRQRAAAGTGAAADRDRRGRLGGAAARHRAGTVSAGDRGAAAGRPHPRDLRCADGAATAGGPRRWAVRAAVGDPGGPVHADRLPARRYRRDHDGRAGAEPAVRRRATPGRDRRCAGDRRCGRRRKRRARARHGGRGQQPRAGHRGHEDARAAAVPAARDVGPGRAGPLAVRAPADRWPTWAAWAATPAAAAAAAAGGIAVSAACAVPLARRVLQRASTG
ncbi:MAG: ABC transporter ATP-binding protein [Actinobacteria bacterium]|nr:ABC transporter ATP-binding protein [Actinomycetota bacterium]